jgi:hypothetical protein
MIMHGEMEKHDLYERIINPEIYLEGLKKSGNISVRIGGACDKIRYGCLPINIRTLYICADLLCTRVFSLLCSIIWGWPSFMSRHLQLMPLGVIPPAYVQFVSSAVPTQRSCANVVVKYSGGSGRKS